MPGDVGNYDIVPHAPNLLGVLLFQASLGHKCGPSLLACKGQSRSRDREADLNTLPWCPRPSDQFREVYRLW
jgi:hypothetical protein